MKKIVSDKSAQIARFENVLREHKEELEACKDKIESLMKKIVKCEGDYAAADQKCQELSTKNHEMTKMLHKMQDGLSKKEQVSLFM